MKNRKNIKKVLGMLMVMTLSITSVMPAFAAVTRTTSDGLVYTDNGQGINYPCWIWKDGYCYYYQNAANILKNTTTPDGYTVDTEGRWVVDGVPQSNGYGNYKMNTEVYNGKSNEEIWNLMVNKLEDVYKEGIPLFNNQGLTYAYWPTKDKGIAFDEGMNGVVENDITVIHDFNGTFVKALIGNAWGDQAENVAGSLEKTSYSQKNEIKEKTIKLIVGDNVGQEVFDFVRAHADKLSEEPGSKVVTDENGNRIHGWNETVFDENGYSIGTIWHDDPDYPGFKIEKVDHAGDGINASTMDLSAWQNRTTDYGKTFSLSIEDGGLTITVQP